MEAETRSTPGLSTALVLACQSDLARRLTWPGMRQGAQGRVSVAGRRPDCTRRHATPWTGLTLGVLAFLVAALVFAGQGVSIALTDPGALRAVIGAGLYLAVLAVLALALGVLLRSSVGTIAGVVALMLVLPGIATALPGSWQDTVVPYLPAEAGQAIIGHTRFAPAGAHLLAPWTGFAILCAYTAVALTAAAIALTKRDSR